MYNFCYTIQLLVLLALACAPARVDAGPLTVGACYTACNTGWVTCLGGYGIVAGTTGPVGWWAWMTSAPAMCSAVQGTCMAACTTTVALPTP